MAGRYNEVDKTMPKPSTSPGSGSAATQRNNAPDNSIFSPLRDNVYLNKINSVLLDFLSKAGQLANSGTSTVASAQKSSGKKRRQDFCRRTAGDAG
ncbi:hypothetical protein DZS_50260 [Dickeya ananatis]